MNTHTHNLADFGRAVRMFLGLLVARVQAGLLTIFTFVQVKNCAFTPVRAFVRGLSADTAYRAPIGAVYDFEENTID